MAIIAQRYRMCRRHGHSVIVAAMGAPPMMWLLVASVAIGTITGLAL